MRRAMVSLLAAVVLAGCGDGPSSQPASASFDASRAFSDLRAQVALGPRPTGSRANRLEAELLARRLRAAGLREVEIQRPYLNVVGHIPGTQPGAVVIGAHHDTKDIPGFVGANDGASGVAVELELARELAHGWRGPELDFAFFDAEESPGPRNGPRKFVRSGDRGSGQYVRYARTGDQGTPPLSSIRAMVLFDLVGDCDLRIPLEANSDPTLYGLFAAAPGADSVFTGRSGGVLDDHTPFERAGVPSVDLIDFDYGPGPAPGAYFHTAKDNVRHVCPLSLGSVGQAALSAIPRIG